MKKYNLGVIGVRKYGKVLMRHFQQAERGHIPRVNRASEAYGDFVQDTGRITSEIL